MTRVGEKTIELECERDGRRPVKTSASVDLLSKTDRQIASNVRSDFRRQRESERNRDHVAEIEELAILEKKIKMMSTSADRLRESTTKERERRRHLADERARQLRDARKRS